MTEHLEQLRKEYNECRRRQRVIAQIIELAIPADEIKDDADLCLSEESGAVN
jgi:hypothetical protein